MFQSKLLLEKEMEMNAMKEEQEREKRKLKEAEAETLQILEVLAKLSALRPQRLKEKEVFMKCVHLRMDIVSEQFLACYVFINTDKEG